MKRFLKNTYRALLVFLCLLSGCEHNSKTPAWNECRYSSNWDGKNASRRMMNIVSPKFTESKFKEYLDWQINRGCDHVHVLLSNSENGEGGGYDCIADDEAKSIAIRRIKEIRNRGLGVVIWVVSDDSDSIRRSIFANPTAYARSLRDFFPFASYIVLGLEMDEGYGHRRGWTALRDAIVAEGWDGPIATHHTSGCYDYVNLGQIVMDQLHHNCTEAQIAESVKALRRKGFDVCGFEYSRNADRAKAQAALDADAFGCGNW